MEICPRKCAAGNTEHIQLQCCQNVDSHIPFETIFIYYRLLLRVGELLIKRMYIHIDSSFFY